MSHKKASAMVYYCFILLYIYIMPSCGVIYQYLTKELNCKGITHNVSSYCNDCETMVVCFQIYEMLARIFPGNSLRCPIKGKPLSN